MKLSPISRKVNIGFWGAVIAALVLVVAATVAYADSTGPLTAIPGLGRLPNETLIRMHKKEVSWYNDQAALFVQANQLSASFQKLIDAETKKKKDVTYLQQALADFNTEITDSQAVHTQSGAIILSLSAWMVDGSVRDRMAAGQSLLDGRSSLNDVKVRLTHGMDVLNKSFDKWRGLRINP